MGTTGQSITLANSIIGVGILAMPFCFQQCGVLLATLILLLMGLVSRLCCYFLLKSALIARRRTFEFLAFHVFGPAGKLAVEVGIIGFLMGTCIAYFVVVGDLGPQIVSKMFNINQSDILRTSIMVIVSLVCVLPLGLLRNVDSLSNVSAATIGFYFCLVIKVIAEAVSQMVAGDWQARVELWRPAGVLQCVPIFSMALFCQTQLFEIFESQSMSLEKMNVVTKNAINICACMYFTLGLFGYIAFCTQTISGNILMSLSPTWGSDVIKLGFVMSLAFSFPLIIFPCRASLYSFLYRKVHTSHHDHIINHSIPETTFRCITVVIIAAALCVSLLLPNIELVLGLVGSTIGVLVCVAFPAACFVNVTFKDTNERLLAKTTFRCITVVIIAAALCVSLLLPNIELVLGPVGSTIGVLVCLEFPAACFVNVTFKDTNERLLAKVILVLGLFIMVLGSYANLQAAEQQTDKYDERVVTQERIDRMVEEFFQAKKLEKSDVLIDPAQLRLQPQDTAQNGKNDEKESEVQPPNPVPPESLSNEKLLKPAESKEVDKENQKLLKPIPDVIAPNKVVEAHPRDLKTKLSNEANGAAIIEKSNEAKEVAKPSEKTQSIQEKIDIKQKQLIETIKQHGEEQKELIKEQKEILDEIKKTKQEIHQEKEKKDSDDAKKIAVESIQKIANMAIQSLGGVSDKPADNAAEIKPLEEIANEAVQEIAKKAVETIEAIKDIKEKPKDDQKTKKESVPNTSKTGIKQPAPNVNNNQENINSAQPVHINNVQYQEALKEPVASKKVIEVKPQEYIKPVPIQKESKDQLPVKQDITNAIKPHQHSPDEPQSYKEGEDLQTVPKNEKRIINGVNQNLPIPIALNANTYVNHDLPNTGPKNADIPKTIIENKDSQNIIKDTAAIRDDKILDNNVKNDDVQNVINRQAAPMRQKREVVDCAEKTTLKPEDKQICDMIANPNTINVEPKDDSLLPLKVDLNDELNRHLENMMQPIRSLKSFNEEEQR